MARKPKSVKVMCKGCGGWTISKTGYCAKEKWCRNMNQRFSDSNIARHTNKRRYVRKDRNTVDDGTRNDMYGVSAEERARRLMMVEKIRAHEALMKMVPR